MPEVKVSLGDRRSREMATSLNICAYDAVPDKEWFFPCLFFEPGVSHLCDVELPDAGYGLK
jgi:hypothetical protein